MASRTMAYDVRRKRWSPELLSQAELDSSRFASVVPSGTVRGKMPDGEPICETNLNAICKHKILGCGNCLPTTPKFNAALIRRSG